MFIVVVCYQVIEMFCEAYQQVHMLYGFLLEALIIVPCTAHIRIM